MYIMSKGKEKNCRLCLEFLDDYYNIIEENTREIFEFLLLKMDLSVSEEPVVCNSCMECVQTAFKFKSICIFVDKQVVSLARDRNYAELDIRDVYLNKNENKDLALNEDYNICRFCLQCLENFNLLNDLRNNSTEKMLLKCIPELDMNIIKDPVVCTACMISLEAYYSFAMKSQNIEKNIMKYCEIQEAEHNGQISLSNVLKFIIKGMPDCIDNCSKANTFKEDNMFQNEGNTYSDINNIVIKIEKEELILKDENMYGDCKTEEDRCGETSRKAVVNCDRVTHKNSSDGIMSGCVTKQKRDLKVDMPTRKDKPDVTMYKCNLCNYKAKFKSRLNYHMLTHKNSSDVVICRCEKCKIKATSRSKLKLKSHMHIYKNESEVTMYKCNLCSYEAKKKYRLECHMLTHKDFAVKVTYKCEKCTFGTRHKDTLKRHKLTHKDKSEDGLELTMHKCTLCNFESKWKVGLRNHLVIHKDSSDVRMYRCEKCTFETKYKSSHEMHMDTHKDKSEVVMYNCNLCSYKSNRKSDVRRHWLAHRAMHK